MKEVNNMYSRVYTLSLVFNNLCEDLITSNSLYKLDEYIKTHFYSSSDVRKAYADDISEFALHNMKIIQEENKRNHHNRTGEIVILEKSYHDDKLEDVQKIKVIFQGYELPKRKNCVFKIREKLADDEILKELYSRKRYLLSPNEQDLLRLYLFSHNVYYKKMAIGFLVGRINDEKSSLAYCDCRHLSNICDLLVPVIKTKKGKIRNIEKGMPKDTIVKTSSPYQDSTVVDEKEVLKEEQTEKIEVEQMTFDKLLKKEGK